MRLKSVKLTQFRGYRTTTVIPVDEAMTGIVGRNDYGKSTILEALAIFFESGDVKADKSDMNCFSSARREGPATVLSPEWMILRPIWPPTVSRRIWQPTSPSGSKRFWPSAVG